MASKQDPRRLAALVGLLAVAAGALVVYQLRSQNAQVAVSDREIGAVGSYKVPVLGWDAKTRRVLPEARAERNLFTFGAPPTPTPDTRPTPTPRPTVPVTPAPTPTPPGILLPDGTRLPVPPSFPLAFIGWLGPDRLPVAVFRDGDDVVAVAMGEVIRKQFIVRRVGPTAVTLGYVGYPESVTNEIQLVR